MIETSLIDWDGKLTTVLFFDKCNFMCPFCQNWELILHPNRYPVIPWQDIESKLRARKEWIDGIVLTGGEPLVNEAEALEIASKVKNLGFKVKLDTNGAYPDRLRKLIEEKIVDYVALDIKAPLDERYMVAAGIRIEIQKITESTTLLKEEVVDYELRTTCVPGIIDKKAIKEIGEVIRGAKRWVLQQYVPENAYKEQYRTLKPFPESVMNELLRIARNYITDVKLRGQNH